MNTMIPNTILKNIRSLGKLYTRRYAHFRNPERNAQISDGLSDLVNNCELKNIEDWNRLKDEVLKLSDRFSAKSVDSIVIGSYITHNKYESALMYIQFLKEKEDELCLAVQGKLLKVYHKLYAETGMSRQKEEEILALVKEIKSKHEHLDTFTNEGIIAALSLTKHWRKCLDTLDEIKIVSDPSFSSYNYIISAAFRNKQDMVGWRLLEEMMSKGKTPSDACFATYIKHLHDLQPHEVLEKMTKLFNFFNVHDFICGEELAEMIQSIFVRENKKAKFSKISLKGSCSNCRKLIPTIKFSDLEFNRLKQVFMERVIVGEDVFRKSTPEELKRFKEFIGQNKKYDVIVDGLNVAYSTGVKKSPLVTSRLVACVVKHYTEQNKSVLVLGRKHMMKWPMKNMSYIKRNSDLFLTQDLSQDDPYLLYCALTSGMQTVIVTRDLMRSHLYLLKDPEHKKTFSRWLSQCQHQLVKVLPSDRVIIKLPLPYVRTTQKLQNHWHVPFTTGSEENDDNWLCIQTK